jgi:hypothetical protein
MGPIPAVSPVTERTALGAAEKVMREFPRQAIPAWKEEMRESVFVKIERLLATTEKLELVRERLSKISSTREASMEMVDVAEFEPFTRMGVVVLAILDGPQKLPLVLMMRSETWLKSQTTDMGDKWPVR